MIPTSAPPSPRRRLLLAPMRAELDPVTERWGLAADGDLFCGQINGQAVAAAATGVGAEQAVKALARLLGQSHFDRVIFFGFAGGLDSTLELGTVVRPQWVIDGKGLAVELSGPGEVPRMVPDADRPAGAEALLSVEETIDSPIRKQRLRQSHRASAVDMESFAIARYAAQHGIGLKIVRAISDTARQTLPTEAAHWVRRDGTTNTPAAIMWLIQHPWRLPDLLRLQHGAALAGAALAEALAQSLGVNENVAAVEP